MTKQAVASLTLPWRWRVEYIKPSLMYSGLGECSSAAPLNGLFRSFTPPRLASRFARSEPSLKSELRSSRPLQGRVRKRETART
jgi:hypothetical protein